MMALGLMNRGIRTVSLWSQSLASRGSVGAPSLVGCQQGLQLARSGPQTEQNRGVVYYSRDKGERQTVPAAADRFYRLAWGGWIRPRAGRHKHLWKKPWDYRWWARQHVFLDAKQSLMLERMVTPEYKKERFFVDDPYAPYQKRNGYDSVPRGKVRVGASYLKLQHGF